MELSKLLFYFFQHIEHSVLMIQQKNKHKENKNGILIKIAKKTKKNKKVAEPTPVAKIKLV